MIFSAPPIFHSEIARINSAIQLFSSQRNNQRDAGTTTKFRYSDEFNTELTKAERQGLQLASNIEENGAEVLKKGAKILMDAVPVRTIAVIVVFVIGFVFLIGMCGCYYYCSCAGMCKGRRNYASNNEQCEHGQKVSNIIMEETVQSPQKKTTYSFAPTKFLSYVPIVMSIVSSVEGKYTAPCFVPVKCHSEIISALVDTGSSITFINEKTVVRLEVTVTREKMAPAIAANGTTISFIEHAIIAITFSNITKEHRVLVTSHEFSPAPITLGMDFLTNIGKPLKFDFQRRILSVNRSSVPILGEKEVKTSKRTHAIRLSRKITLLPNSDNFVIAEIDGSFSDDCECVAEDTVSDQIPEGILVGKILSCPGKSKSFPLRVLNTSNAHVTLYPNQHIANAEEIEKQLLRPIYSVFEATETVRENHASEQIKEKIDYVPEELNSDDFDSGDCISKINWKDSKLRLDQKSRIVDLMNKYGDIFLGRNKSLGR
ncbi:hypothetical protein ANCDUO_00832 [Ancylostoma duodenale]|uniref:Peptidase A2 domain-containing protein n=1 Tax=Ancylostoma duodenale TaxID=51022 RepID=A0A0C2H4V1_9BILA|nr:hypothetical protein ANCDUO_00832 [Ancylostoma duodenale]